MRGSLSGEGGQWRAIHLTDLVCRLMCHLHPTHLRLHKLGLDFDGFLEILGLAKFVHVLINLAMKRKLLSTEDG